MKNETKPESEQEYLERAVQIQADKIERQREQLSRYDRLYRRDVRQAKIGETFFFWLKVIYYRFKTKI